MDYADSEKALFEREAEYIADLRQSLPELDEQVLNIMAGLYRAGWRDSYHAIAADPRTRWGAINAMRRDGYAVVLFSPEELQGADRQRFEERLDDLGTELADEMQPETDWID